MLRKSLICIFISGLLMSSLLPLAAQEKQESGNQLIKAVASFNSRKYQDAKKQLLAIVGEDPDDDAANYYLGLTEFYLREDEEAEMFLKKAVELDSTNYWYRDRLAAVYQSLGKTDKTVEIYESLIRYFPKKTDIYYSLVNLYAQQNNAEKMTETLETIFTLFGRAPQTLTMYADIKMSEYKDSVALAYYEEALEYDEAYSPALMGKAEILRVRRKFPEYFKTIGAFVRDADTDPAMKTQYLTSLIQRTDPHFLQNYRTQIDSLMDSCVLTHPDDTSSLQLVGSYYYTTGRADRSLVHIRKNRDLHPDNLTANALYVQLLNLTEDWETLAKESSEAYKVFPKEMAFLQYANMAYYNLQDYQKVIDISEEMLRTAPHDSATVLVAYSTIGDMYHQLGQSAKAYAAYDKALKVNPTYASVLNNYAYYLSMEGKKLKKAYAMAKIAVEQEPDNSTYLDTFGWILYLQGKPLEAKPFFKHAMLYGGKESVTVLEHYAQVLRALKEDDLAKVYENLARNKK